MSERSSTALSVSSQLLGVYTESVVEQVFHEFTCDNKALKTFNEFQIWQKRSRQPGNHGNNLSHSPEVNVKGSFHPSNWLHVTHVTDMTSLLNEHTVNCVSSNFYLQQVVQLSYRVIRDQNKTVLFDIVQIHFIRSTSLSVSITSEK